MPGECHQPGGDRREDHNHARVADTREKQHEGHTAGDDTGRQRHQHDRGIEESEHIGHDVERGEDADGDEILGAHPDIDSALDFGVGGAGSVEGHEAPADTSPRNCQPRARRRSRQNRA